MNRTTPVQNLIPLLQHPNPLTSLLPYFSTP